MRGFWVVWAVAPIAIALVACSDDDSSETSATVATATNAPAVTTRPPTSPPPTTASPSTTPPTTAAPATARPTAAPTTTEPPPTTDPDAPPPVEGIIAHGTYVGGEFDTPLTFTTDHSWSTLASPEGILLTEKLDLGEIRATGEMVIDASTDLSYDDALAALLEIEDFEFGSPEPTTVGGLTGSVVSAPATDPRG
jgi:hypothetical protein